jgi:hypothetical protein
MRRLAICVGLLAALAVPPVAHGDAVIDWSLHAQSAILSTGPTAHHSTLSFAMVQGAVYDAVNSIDRRHQRYLRVPWVKRSASKDAAAATAAFRVLVALFPAQAPTLQGHYDASLAAIPDGKVKTRGIAAGEAAAAAMLEEREGDGRLPAGTPYPFPQGTTPGAWRVSAPLTAVEPAWWVGNVKPFLVPSARLLRTDGPNRLTSQAYAREFNEVKRLGAVDSPYRTPDQTMAAIFWQAQPLQIYGNLMRGLSARYGLSGAQTARMFAMVTLAAADGAIGCWSDKYDRLFWRPIDAVRLADTDGNPRTEADPVWRPLFDPSTPTTPALATPNFPEHPSGHGCVSSAAINALREFFGTDRIAFDLSSPRFPGQTRHFDRFSDVIDEIIEARIWGGIHFRTANVQGAELGEQVARWERWLYFHRIR